MKYLLIATLVAAAAFATAADGHPGWLSEVFEHVINPEFPQPPNPKESS